MNQVYVLLGANIGDPLNQLAQAREQISRKLGHIEQASSIYESEAWGEEDQPIFLNQVLLVESELSAEEFLQIALSIENDLGRIRFKKWGSRVIDIDMLYYNEEIIDSENLKIPHPFLHQRNFTLVPLVEISPQYIHPVLKKSNKDLLLGSKDQLLVNILKS
ncbi:2-amino-4-hydroxy-6-hydroxymethyldihydropteridine diphosphokinase [Sphingobacterium kyonggiense]|uniref:2-amino-4-hydroxy-6-hydroxymethyldihydropteridine pyrophosphokinase n=1 Tax=Sphingobacterium kyonggiense TaxID=714075 RepID=A0ABP7YGZ0_9SPHI